MRTTQRGWWLNAQTAVIAAAIAVSGCQADISPQPEPPVRQDIFEVDFGQVEATVDSYSNGVSGLEGAPGSAKPPGATLRAVNLDNLDDPVETTIQPDGSFAVEFSVAIGDEVRLQIFSDALRSDPFDVWVEADESPPTPVTRALADCLKLTPPLELVLASGAGEVRVDNDCSEPVQLATPYLRRPVPGLSIGAGQTWPANLPAGATINIAIAIDGSTPLPLSEVVFIEAMSPQNDRRPITVRTND
jgi:hypothetical protein